jgi:hypothetical protein
MEKNKTGKYLKYAIGEIILVVVGILIALQINNWNAEKKTAITELKILEVMQKNLNSDLRDIDINIQFHKVRQQATKEVLASLNSSLDKKDSLSFSYANLDFYPFFIETTSAYDNLKSIGFEIIKNDSLKENIMFIYGNKYQLMENYEERHSNFWNTKLAPLLIDNLIIENNDKSGKPINVAELKKNHQFKETLKESYGFHTYMILRNTELMDAVTLLVQQITTELKQRQ